MIYLSERGLGSERRDDDEAQGKNGLRRVLGSSRFGQVFRLLVLG